MKILIITALLTFVIATGVTMFSTGTFKQITSRTNKPTETEQKAQEEAETAQTQENGAIEATKAEEAHTVKDTQTKVGNTQPREDKAIGAPETYSEDLETKLAEYKTQIAAAEAKLADIKAETKSLTSAKASATASQQLAKVYGSMRPDSAASILCQLEETISVRILMEMNNRTAGKILDAIASADPDYAARISKLMAKS